MTVLFLCNYKSIYGGNFIPSLLELGKYIKRSKGSCLFALPVETEGRDWVNIMQREGEIVTFIDFSQPLYSFLKSLKGLVNGHSVDVIHSHHVNTLTMDLYSLFDKRTKVVIHIHSDFSAGKKSLKIKILNYCVYHVLARRVKMLSVSKALVSYNPKRVSYVPNALASRRLSETEENREVFRNKLNISKESVLVEIFGWAPHIKGLDIAVEAIKKARILSDRNIDLLVICGREMTPDKLKQWILEHTTCNGKENFLHFAEQREDVFTFHKASDILLSASRSEGFSYSILEMLSIGKPVISSDIPGVQWSKDFNSVYFFKSEDVDECANTLCNLLAQDFRTINQQSIQSVKGYYSIEKWCNTILEAYGKML